MKVESRISVARIPLVEVEKFLENEETRKLEP